MEIEANYMIYLGVIINANFHFLTDYNNCKYGEIFQDIS